jgi:predicted DCC family thiol-disulfide oxidoreductase YuxK
MDLTEEYSNKGIVLFDGMCNLCDNSVQLIIKNDRNDYFRFAALQSETGTQLLKQAGLPDDFLETFVYFEDDKFYTRSTAALKISKHLDGAWKLFYPLIIFPAPLRDFFYTLIAKNRYKFFGKKDECMLPTPELQKKFI